MMTKPAQYVITLLAIIFLFFLGSNSYTVLIRYIIFIIMLLVPGSAISGWLIFPRHFSFSFKFFGGFFLFLPTLIPVYLLRKLTLFPHYYFDMIFVAILWFFFYKITLYKKIIKLFKSDDLRKSIPILLIVLPACFYLIWLGNGVNFKDKIRYFGLFPVDFGNLASVVTLIKISDFLPLSDVAGSGLLHYHWFYFVLPAYFCDFMGGEVNSANALILTNLVVAFNFFYILLEFVRIVIQPTLGLYSRVFAVSVVLFAPTIIYFYQELSIILAVDSFNLGVRNHLLLSPINSLVNFGNNIVAIGLIIILCMFENEQEKIGDSYFIIFITVLWVLIIPYSITLFFPVTLALLLWLVFYYKKYIKFLKKSYNFILSIGVVIILFSIYFAIGILSKSTYKIAIAFDNLQYLQNVFFSLTPIILLAIYYLVKNKKIEFYFVVWFCCLLVPTVLYIEGSPTGKIDFSMKTFTLLAVILVPIVAWSLNDAFSNSSKSLKIIIAFFIFSGILNSFFYAFQFVGYRYFGVKKQFFEIDYDYFKTLDYLRVRSNKSSIIFDPQSLQRDDINLTLWLSERRTYLVPKSLHFQGDKRLLDRNNQWEAWRKNGFDKIQECKLSKNIDFLIGKSDWPMSIFFKNEIEFGDFVVMKSIKTLIDCNAIGHE